MARIKSSSFVGVHPREADPDSTMLRQKLIDAFGDLARVYDIITGQNGESSAVYFDGEGRGGLLGYPIVNQTVEKTLRATDAVKGVDEDTIIWSAPVPLARGERELFVRLRARSTIDQQQYGDVTIEVRNASDALVVDPIQMRRSRDGQNDVWFTATIDRGEDPAAEVLYFFVRMGTLDEGDTVFRSIQIYPRPSVGLYSGGPPTTPGALGNQYRVTAPSAGAGLSWQDLYDQQFDLNDPIDAYILSRWNQNANALWEYLTGSPVPGNATRTLEDHSSGSFDDTNPTSARSFSHTRSCYANEPQMAMPILVSCLGAVAGDGGFVVDTSTGDGLADWCAPYANATVAVTSHQLVRRWRIYMPDFQTASSALKVTLLLSGSTAGGGSPTSWRWQWNSTGTGGEGTPVQMGSSRFYTLTLSGVAFTADVAATYSLFARRTSAAFPTAEEMALVGIAVYFDPS